MLNDEAISSKIIYAISSWIFRSQNCLYYGKNPDFENEMAFFSNNFDISNLLIDRFYRLQIHNNGKTDTEHYSKKNVKDDFFVELADLKSKHVLSYFKKNFDKVDAPRNRALLIVLQEAWFIVKDKLENAQDSDSISSLNPIDFENYMDELFNWKDIAITNSDLSFDCIFVPGTYQSIFSNEHYFYEIKHNKFQSKSFDDKVHLYGNSKEEKALYFDELEKCEYGQNFDDRISYFNPFLLLQKKYRHKFYEIIKVLYQRFLEDCEQEFGSFMTELLHIINNTYFNSIIAQQQYVFNRIFLYHSKNRKMTIDELIINMQNRIQESGQDSLYFHDTLCHFKTLSKLSTLLTQLNITSITEELVYEIIPSYSNSPKELDELLSIAYLLGRLYKKTALIEFVDTALFHIKNHFLKYKIKYNRKTNDFFSKFLYDLFQVNKKIKGDRKYLNDFYLNDLNSFLKKNRVFTSKLLDQFDFLKPKKIKGEVDEETTSTVFKKR